MIKFQEYLQSDYPGFASFIETIIYPIFGESFRADENIEDMIDCLNDDPKELEYYDEIEKSTDDRLKTLAADNGLERVLKLGIIHIQGDTRPIYVYDITVSNRRQLARNRKGIQQLISRTLDNQSGAFMLFHYNDEKWEWRFSYKFVGKDKEDSTNSKRFTYLLGRDQVCKTAAQRFNNLLNKKGKIAFDDITEAFSVEKVSKEFFDHYRSIYADIVCHVTGKRMVKNGGKWEEKLEHEPNSFIMDQFAQFADPEKTVRDYVKKLMGRLVFLQFIQKKGWLGVPVEDETWTQGDKAFIQHQFDLCDDKVNFIDNVLEKLFDDINTRRPKDIANAVLGANIKIPYLNGGLFEKDAEDDTLFPLPAHFMDEMLNDFFSAYNFTIDENDPSDAEVGVDPEMLGRVFENLLEDNKDKGAFYTPKEIVQYMCRESLIAYLQTDVEDESRKQSFRDFVATHEVIALNPADVFKVDKKLREVKICDPAIGSGAFPMGLLKELFDCRMAIEGEEEGKTPAEIKKDIIQNSIYGVDIEKGAVDIARLRFWLSLIIDEQTPHALPNMDFKIMQGNSLLEQYEEVELSGMSLYEQAKKNVKKGEALQISLEMDEKDDLDNIQKRIKRYYQTDNSEEKKILRKGINESVKSYIKHLRGCTSEIKDKLDKLPIPNDQFFLWHIYFKEVFDLGGFDIVIGNPPYIQLQANEGLLSSIYNDKGFETFDSTGDIFSLFYEQGWRLLRKKGCLCYITSNKWMRNNSGEKTRKFLVERTNPLLLINFEDIQLFDNATVETNILLYTNETNQNKTTAVVTDNKANDILTSISDYVASHSVCMSFTTTDSWVVLSKEESAIMDKINRNSTLLKNLKIDINFGIKTGYNSAFLIDGSTRSHILEKCVNDEERKATEEIIKPVLRGRDIKRYQAHWDDCWLINTHNGIPGILLPIDIDNYPALKEYLMTHWERINKRSDKGRTPFNLRNCAYVLDFSKPKIVWGEISDRSKFSYDEDGQYFCEATTFFMTGEISSFLLCYLNSKLAEYLFSKIATTTGMGTVRWKKYKIEQLPIPHISKEIKQEVDSLYRQYLSSKELSYLDKIDRLVYDLYGLTEEEIAIVEGKAQA